MKMPRSKTAPITDNKEAAALIAIAKDHCHGCRLSWRLKDWKHGIPMIMECTAKEQRQALRDIAARRVRS